MKPDLRSIVICGGLRTPIGHVAKSLAEWSADDLMEVVIRQLVARSRVPARAVDGVLIGWVGQGSQAPNIARISTLRAGLGENVPAFTVQANCISSLETVASAARHIMSGEGEIYIAGGTESMSNFPYAIRGPRSHKALRSLQTLKAQWADVPHLPDVVLTDTTEEGLTDPLEKINMAATAELCAQTFEVSRASQDAYALESFRRARQAVQDGFYCRHIIPLSDSQRGGLDHDEYLELRDSLLQKPQLMGKAPVLFDSPSYPFATFFKDNARHLEGLSYDPARHQATVSLFNSCARSDGAAAVLVASEAKARELHLPILARLRGWGFVGNNPAEMGLAPLYATELALERAELEFSQLAEIELHEAFAATCLSIFRLGQTEYAQDWEGSWRKGTLNPRGGTLALGHPLAATGVRLLLNLVYGLATCPPGSAGLAAACASGGLGGAMVVERGD